jgi:glutamyl-tRNA synthetase
VLIKSDGIPTYHFAAIVDDHLMEISHVTRGSEWLPSLPKNILLFQDFGWTAPKYIHLPLILNKGGGKLSKRQGDVFVEDYLAKGYLPEALINFCVLLGWHPKGDREIYSLEELEKIFDIRGIGANPAVFDTDKLDFFNGHYIRQKSLVELTDLVIPYLGETSQKIDREKLEKIISLAQDRLVVLSDINNLIKPYIQEIEYAPSLLLWKSLAKEEIKEKLEEMQSVMNNIPEHDWTKEKLEEKIFSYIKSKEGKNGDYLWPLRVSLTGEKNSPGPFESAWALGREESLKRIAAGISLCLQS